MNPKPGSRWASCVCTAEVVVVRPPKEPVVPACGGHPMVAQGGARPEGLALDADGYLFIEGRLDDVIVRGGENISSGEIEDRLRAHPSVADVAVLGVPDDRCGERIAAVIVTREPRPISEALAVWVKEKLGSTKTSEVWRFRDALPYNGTGKLPQRALGQNLATSPPPLG